MLGVAPILAFASAFALALALAPQERRLPVPGAGELRTAEADVRAVFGSELANPSRREKAALARKLLAQAREESNGAATRYALLAFARDAAAEGADFSTGFAAVDELLRRFEIPKLASLGGGFSNEANLHKVAFLIAAKKWAESEDDQAILAHAHLDLAEIALAASEFADAEAAASQVAKLAKDSTLAPRAAEIVKDAPLLARERVAVAQATSTLATTPEDAAAHLALGLHALFATRDVEGGLNHLAHGSDAKLASLAASELAKPSGARAIADLAERWLALAEAERPGLVQRRYRGRARELLESAASLGGGLIRADIDKRLAEIAPLAPAGKTILFHSSDSLLRFTTSGGTWRVDDGELLGSCPGGSEWATLTTKYRAIESVTVRARIVPPSKQNLRLWVGPLHLIFDWEMADENHFRNGTELSVVKGHALEPGVEHEIVLQQAGKKVLVNIDGRTLWSPQAELSGTVSFQGALGNQIALKLVRVEGTPDPGARVEAETREKP